MRSSPDRMKKGLWWDKALTLVKGCTPCALECENCWSARETHMRRSNPNGKVAADNRGLVDAKGTFNGTLRLMPENLDKLGSVSGPQVFAVWNDLHHEDVADSFRTLAYRAFHDNQRHTIIVLTKRPGLARLDVAKKREWVTLLEDSPNVIWGTTCGHPGSIGRVADMVEVPAQTRVVSAEPLIGPVNLLPWMFRCSCCHEAWSDNASWRWTGHEWQHKCTARMGGNVGHFAAERTNQIHWVQAGCESGGGRRPCYPGWMNNMIANCKAACVPVFLKQFDFGDGVLKLPPWWGRKWNDFPLLPGEEPTCQPRL